MAKSQENKRACPTPLSKSRACFRKTLTKRKPKPPPKQSCNPRRLAPPPENPAELNGSIPENSFGDRLLFSVSELLFPGGMETLLPCGSRKPLPEISQRPGRKCILMEIVAHAPEIYQRLISQIQCGVSLNVAAETAGINESTFFDWSYRGSKDATSNPPRDTYYSRFYYDVRRAVATCAASAERRITESSPTKYLAHGAGRIFGNAWGKDPGRRANERAQGISTAQQKSLPSPDEAIEATFTVQHQPVIEEQGAEPDESVQRGRDAEHSHRTVGQDSSLPLSTQQEFQALEILESIGLIEIKDSLRQAFRQQAGGDGG